jgi:citronellol/citronellal dehydrogenase
MGDAAYCVLTKKSQKFTGKFLIDEDFLKEEGVTSFDQYLFDVDKPHLGSKL